MGARIRKITVSDYTLREMGESGSSRLLFKEKLAIALGIDRYGADVIELPEVKSLKEDRIIFRTIAQSVRGAAVAIPVGRSAEDVAVAGYDDYASNKIEGVELTTYRVNVEEMIY